MTEADFREILRNLDHLFFVRKVGSAGDSWLAQGDLTEGHTVNDIEMYLESLPANADVRHYDGSVWLKISEKPEEETRSQPPLVIPTVNIVLFLLTVVTTLIAGSILQGGTPLSRLADIAKGVPYSFALLLILGSHEFGHYAYARKYHVTATLPYFLPAPPFLLLIGTFGAFIRIKSRIYTRRALLEIGAAGPIAGFVVSVVAIIIGYSLIPSQDAVYDHINRVHHLMGLDSQPANGLQLSMGTSILFSAMSSVFNVTIPMDEIYHFPLIFAGWIGFLVTMLNLLPIGQLDGGHIAYAILGEKHNKMAKWIFLLLIPLGFLSANWWVWAVLIFLLMGTWKHPPIAGIGTPISRREKLIGIFCLLILVTCFIPIPIKVY
ncbi:MAG: site-2 protease family protein [Fidelibacterota bacterium]